MHDHTREAVHRSIEAIARAIDNESDDSKERLSQDQDMSSVFEQSDTIRIPIGTSLADAERLLIVATLKKCGGNKTRAAATLGLSLKTLYNRLHAWEAEAKSDTGKEYPNIRSRN